MILEEQFYYDRLPYFNPDVLPSKVERDTMLIKDYAEPVMMAKPLQDEPIGVVAVAQVEVGEPQVETILGNELTNSQKWAWVIGLTFAAWAIIYWSNKESK